LDAPALDDSEHAFHHPNHQNREFLINGKLGLGGSMPALGDHLTEKEIQAVISYLHSLWTFEQLQSQQDITARWLATPTPEDK
jgi:mono/diheme cytochrome c family protein